MNKFVAMILATLTVSLSAIKVDKNLEEYKPVTGVSGTLNSIGSDTLNNMMALWTEAFKRHYPNVKTQVEGKGSSTAPPALIAGTSQVGPMSRAMKSAEVDAFEKKFNYKPLNIGVAIDALAVFVHKDNPIKGMSLKQVDSVFSSTYKQGGSEIAKWGALNLDGSWSVKPISLYGRNSVSGTYGFFKKVALKKGSFKKTVKEQPGSSAVVNSISNDMAAIGYSGIGYKTAGVRALPLSVSGMDFKEPTMGNCLNRSYPLSRVLWIYINKKPNQKLDKLTHEFLKFILSKEGQQIVAKDGYFPLPASSCKKYLTVLAK